MEWLMRIVAVFILSILSGCLLPDVKKLDNPLANMNLKNERDSKKLAALHNKKVKVVLSENTKNFITYKKEVAKFFHNFNDKGDEISNPKTVPNLMIAMLKKNITQDLTLASSIQSSNDSNPVILVDIWESYTRNGLMTMDIENKIGLYFIDPTSQSIFWTSTAENKLSCTNSPANSPDANVKHGANCAISVETNTVNMIEADIKTEMQASLPTIPSSDMHLNKIDDGNNE